LPADVLAYGALFLVAGVAFLSGVLFAGVLGYLLLNALRRAGVVKDRPPAPANRRVVPIFLVCALLLTTSLTVYLRQTLRGPATVHIGGAVEAPYDYPRQNDDIQAITAEGALRGVKSRNTGVPLRELLTRARPQPGASLVLVQASDGYSFFVSMEEVAENPGLLLASQGKGKDASYNLVGPLNSKAWVRSVKELTVIGGATLEVTGALESPAPFNPNDWQFQMDSANLDLGQGSRKLQGAPLGKVLQAMKPRSEATAIVLQTGGEPVTLSLVEVMGDDAIRIFTVIDPDAISFAVGRMDGQVIAPKVIRVRVQ
jgi:DMSO/TMAO reductase YedYZ molybdopterin-dependent catalytic subunit